MPTLLQSWLKHHQKYQAEGRKLAIYMGPGGNSGVIGGGIITAMHNLNALLPNAMYVGGSVGAYALMYTLVTKDHRAPTLFGTSFSNTRYFSALRLFTKRPALNLDYVVDEVLEHHVPMNYVAAVNSPYKLFAVTSDARGEPDLKPLTGISKAEAQNILRCTASMPLLGRIHNTHDLAGWDGWLVEHRLLSHLQEQGITDIVWILNRPLAATDSFTGRLVWKRIIRKLESNNPMLAALVKERLNAGDFLSTPPQNLHLEIIHPHTDIPGTTRNPATLFNALGTSYRHMATYLGQPHLPYPAEWQPWQHHMPPAPKTSTNAKSNPPAP